MSSICSPRRYGVTARIVGLAVACMAALLIVSCAESADPASSGSAAGPPSSSVTAPASIAEPQYAALYQGIHATPQELVSAFAHDFLQLEDAVVTASGDGAVNTWRITSARLDLEVTTEGFGFFEVERLGAVEEIGPVWGITDVADLTTDDNWYLTARVSSTDGLWTARVVFPPPDVEALIKLASGDWEVGAPTDDGEITMDLPMRPVAPVRLLVVCYEGTEVTGVHGVILDPIDLFTD